jgi:hypothetical protein
VPIKPYAKQNFLRDWIKPTEKTMSGRKIPRRTLGEALVEINPARALTLKKRPMRATTWR